MKKNYTKWIVTGIFLLITAVFFYKSFTGYSLQGSDSTLAIMKKASAQVNHVSSYWQDDFWLGMKSSLFSVNIFTFVMKVVPYDQVQFVTYFLSIALALIFMFAFLRKLKLSLFSAIFGAIAYAFTPHFITLATAAHLTVIEMMIYPPLLFHLLTILFDPEENDTFKKTVSLILSGAVWGIMMADDVQRGLYFSIAAAVYIVFSIFRKNDVHPANFLKKITDKKLLLDAGKVLLILAVLFLAFFNGLKGWLPSLQLRSAQAKSVTAQPEQSKEVKWKNSTDWSYHPLELIDSFAFGYHGNFSGDIKSPYWGSFLYAGSSESLGFFVILFALIGLFAYYRKSFMVKFFFWTGLTALILSFGRYLPGTPFYWLFYQLPLMGNFRVPAKFIAVTAFAASILAAFGFEFLYDLLKEEAEKHNKLLSNVIKIAGVVLGIMVIWLLYCLVSWNDLSFGIGQKLGNPNLGQTAVSNIVLALVRVIVFLALSLAIFIAFLKLRKVPFILPASASAFVLLLIIDLWSIDWFYMNKAYFHPNEFYREDGTIQFLKSEYQKDTFRVAASLLVPVNGQAQPYPVTGLKGYYQTYMFPYYGIQPMDVNGYLGIFADYNQFFLKLMENTSVLQIQTVDDLVELNLRIARMANVKYIVMDNMTGNTNLLLTNVVRGYDGGEHYIYYVRGYLPRVGFYDSAVPVAANSDALAYLGSKDFNFDRYIALNGPVAANQNSTNRVIPQQIVSYETWRVTSSVNAPSDGWLLFNTKYEPDWKAYVDGKKTPVYPANYLLMGVPVTKGVHSVEFRFEPENFSFFVSFFTILAGLLAAAAYGIKILIDRKGQNSSNG